MSRENSFIRFVKANWSREQIVDELVWVGREVRIGDRAYITFADRSERRVDRCTDRQLAEVRKARRLLLEMVDSAFETVEAGALEGGGKNGE